MNVINAYSHTEGSPCSFSLCLLHKYAKMSKNACSTFIVLKYGILLPVLQNCWPDITPWLIVEQCVNAVLGHLNHVSHDMLAVKV